MKCMIGSTPSHVIVRDVTTAFVVCWQRLQKVCEFSDSTIQDAAITVYGKIDKSKRMQLQSQPVDGFQDNVFIQAATMAIHAAAAAQATSSAEEAMVRHANSFMQAAAQAVCNAVHNAEGVSVAECGAASAPEVAAWPNCVPRGAQMFPSEAPRPSESAQNHASTTNATALRAYEAYSSYVQIHAPRAGAEACWACPYCLSSTSRGAFQANGQCFRRHVREQHPSNYDASDIGAYLDRSPLLWCIKTEGRWQPVFGDGVMRVVSTYTRGL
jgi:hypothetical protein